MDPRTWRTMTERATTESEPAAERTTAVLKALADPTRRAIVELIRRRGEETCVCELEGHFEVAQSTLSHHLKVLREAGLIESRSEGVRTLHRLVPGAFAELEAWARRLARSRQKIRA